MFKAGALSNDQRSLVKAISQMSIHSNKGYITDSLMCQHGNRIVKLKVLAKGPQDRVTLFSSGVPMSCRAGPERNHSELDELTESCAIPRGEESERRTMGRGEAGRARGRSTPRETEVQRDMES